MFDRQSSRWTDLGPITVHPDQEWDFLKSSWDPWSRDSSALTFVSDNSVVVVAPDGTRRKNQTRHPNKRATLVSMYGQPIDCGWEIGIYERGRTENIARLTPPLHFVPNPRYIEGWHFRNEDNTGPNDGSVNAPQKRREFIFSPEVGETIDGPQATYGVTPGEVDRVEAFGRGTVEITHLKLSPPRENEKARIFAMEFRCKIVWRQRPLEEITTDTVKTP